MVFSSESDSRKEPWAISWGRPMASSTCEGSSEPEVQAEPEEPAMPIRSSDRSSASPSMKRKQTLTLPGRRCSGWPLSRV